jgi:histidyl-tRNA synthetase
MKPALPQGTRDFDSTTITKREYILDIIKEQFVLHGFEPLETPAFERLETLMGKYGDEGDKLIFKILNNGLDKKENKEAVKQNFENVLSGKNDSNITQRALKYDLTIPFARYVAMNFGNLAMPFKRFQIQNVWRADRPQKGRYREFTQCDADIVGSPSLLNEIELADIYHKVFNKLKIPVEICINNRKVLTALSELCGPANSMTDLAIAIDKLDKIGLEKVLEELRNRKFSYDAIDIIKQYLQTQTLSTNEEKIESITQLLGEKGKAGIDELKEVLASSPFLTIDFTLARGLDYYTGSIFEVKPTEVKIGSIGGGGRYDDLTALFGLKQDVPGVGISFGVDRIYDVLEESNGFPEKISQQKTVLVANFGPEYSQDILQIATDLRKEKISCTLYPDAKKIDKQFKYANRNSFDFIILFGEDEKAQNSVQLKNLATGEQLNTSIQEAIQTIQKA